MRKYFHLFIPNNYLNKSSASDYRIRVLTLFTRKFFKYLLQHFLPYRNLLNKSKTFNYVTLIVHVFKLFPLKLPKNLLRNDLTTNYGDYLDNKYPGPDSKTSNNLKSRKEKEKRIVFTSFLRVFYSFYEFTWDEEDII